MTIPGTAMHLAHDALESSPLDQLAKAIYMINGDNGWFVTERSLSDEFMLIVGEVAEAHEEDRKGKGPSERYHTFTFNTADPELPEALIQLSMGEIAASDVNPSELPVKYCKPEGIPSEMADIIIRVLDFCYRYEIDIESVLLEKLAYNETRGYRHGGKKI